MEIRHDCNFPLLPVDVFNVAKIDKKWQCPVCGQNHLLVYERNRRHNLRYYLPTFNKKNRQWKKTARKAIDERIRY